MAVACAPEDIPASHTLIEPMQGINNLPFELILKRLVFSRGAIRKFDDLDSLKYLWLDYQPNSLAWPVLSERMRELIDRNATGEEGIDWISVMIRRGEVEARQYHILRFKQPVDVLNREQTIFAGATDLIVRPAFDQAKVANLSVFCAPEPFWQITSGIYVSEKIKRQAKAEKLIGLHFENAITV